MTALAREAVRAAVAGDGRRRVYAPGRRYRRGEAIRLLDGRLGDVVRVERGKNARQGSFEVIFLRLDDGEVVRFVAGVEGEAAPLAPGAVDARIVDRMLAEQGQEVVRAVRRALAADPRFMTLYDRDGEYGCLREFFPPMSPDVLDAALALILDTLFDQVPISHLMDLAPEMLDAAAATVAPASALFSERDLDGALATLGVTENEARVAFEAARSLWLRAVQRAEAWDTAQMDRAFVQPLMRVLGWAGVPVPGAESSASGSRPYALCRDEVAGAELYMHYEADAPLAPWAWALAQTVSWGRPLDQPAAPQPDAAGDASAAGVAVPSHRMAGALTRTGVRWGLLTNGRAWRLVGGDGHSLTRSFYEMDVSAIFAGLGPGDRPDEQQWADFRRWLLLFHRTSYVPGADGLTPLDRLSQRAPEGGDDGLALLRRRLLHVVLPVIAGGFVAYRRQRSGVASESALNLDRIYRASVILLARMIFVLAAEARHLFPIHDPAYRPYSLTAQAHWAMERVARDLPLSTGVYTTPRYDLLLALLRRISDGDPEKQLPCYGRLFFDPLEHPDHAFLDQYRLSDQVVALALDALVRDIDYGALDARDVSGALTEVLNVYLTVIDEESGDVRITRYEDLQPGREGDRVAWPDYVVKASVEQALLPVLDRRYEVFVEAMTRVAVTRDRLNRALDRRLRAELYGAWEQASQDALRAFLGLRVCDPAMGSGTFLMSAVDVLTDGIVARLDAYHEAHPHVPRAWNPVYRLLDQVRRDVREELARQGITPEGGAWDDATTLSRLVAERCVFGVTRDRLGVEVARMGLWLHTFTWGAPLTFLDHHLRRGDGLLGAELVDVAADLDVGALSDGVLEAVNTMYAITSRTDTTPLDVRWSASQFEKVEEALLPYRTLLDFWVEAKQGDRDAQKALRAAEGVPLHRWLEDLDPALVLWIAEQSKGEGHVHWELAFPEVFTDLASGGWAEDPGFDVVVGSPPWTSPADPALAAYYAARFGDDEGDEVDVHRAYLTLGRRLVRRQGRTAYVLSRRWLVDARGGV